MLFRNRSDAGEQLAEKLKGYRNSVILAIPRGGLEVALPIAKKTNSTIDIIVARKVALPQDPEAGIGAVTPDGTAVYNPRYLEQMGLTEEDLSIMEKEARDEAARREKVYHVKKHSLQNNTVILVDDGLATGYTMLAAIKSARKCKPKKIVAAVPVASHDAYELVKKECDEIVCLHVSESWAFAVAAFYEEFPQLSDDEVIALLKKANEKNK